MKMALSGLVLTTEAAGDGSWDLDIGPSSRIKPFGSNSFIVKVFTIWPKNDPTVSKATGVESLYWRQELQATSGTARAEFLRRHPSLTLARPPQNGLHRIL